MLSGAAHLLLWQSGASRCAADTNAFCAVPERWLGRRLSVLGDLTAERVEGDCVGLGAAAPAGV
jgi:hypothetical protein